MISKSLIALLILLPIIHTITVSPVDASAWNRYAFESVYPLNGVLDTQQISVSLQYQGTSVPMAFSLRKQDDTNFVIPNTLLSCAAGAGTGTRTCSVTIPVDKTNRPSGNYDLTVVSSEVPFSGSLNYLRVGQLTVTTDKRGTVLRQMIIPSNVRAHRIYVPTTADYTFSVSYAGTLLDATPTTHLNYINDITAPGKFLKFYKQNGVLPFSVGTYADLTHVGTVDITTTPGAAKLKYNLSNGYWWILVDISLDGTKTTTTLKGYDAGLTYGLAYSTQQYICPYDTFFSDPLGLFAGCITQSTVNGSQCVQFDNSTKLCKQCFTGYTLSADGKCLQTPCPAGQYKHYGVCYQNPTGCTNYTDFAKCLSCADTYKLNNGSCDRVPLNCGNRQFYNKTTYTCDKVSDKCNAFDPATGLCTTCASATDKVISGVCVTTAVNCTSRQYIANAACVDVNPTCLTFVLNGGQCTACSFGFVFDSKKVCVKLNCTGRTHPDQYGQCVMVDPLCATWTQHGDCLSCTSDSHIVVDGECLQIISGSPCAARQYLGLDSKCADVSELCVDFDVKLGCKSCLNGYVVVNFGQCVKKAVCTGEGRFYLVNNDCHQVSPTCDRYDTNTGRCLTCLAGYQYYTGLCIDTSSCGPRQWTNDSKTCNNVDAGCNQFNPSSGACYSCVQGYTLDTQGYGKCCIKGTFNVGNKCGTQAEQAAYDQVNQNGCAGGLYNLSCLQCKDGWNLVTGDDGIDRCIKK